MSILRKTLSICGVIPLLGSAITTLIHYFSSSSSSMSSDGNKDDLATADNRAAQKHYRQPQHIRTS
ncbi:hypothetical protein L484_027218 [Morus notabilis]|uniref:Uncharacterized protein n=1 Tax=Morus notabilis TaxID=981085 RepID=W9S1A2_9ROSA|nr:hypothetical protein L484_027218 [Morus notabilis]